VHLTSKINQVSHGLQQCAQKVLNNCKKATGKFVQKTASTYKMYMLKCPGANRFHLSTYRAPIRGHWKNPKSLFDLAKNFN
jgi:hypothetical protein